MTWGNVAVGVGVVGAGVLSSRASAKAAGIAGEGAERSGAQIQAAADRARTDVLNFFPAASRDLLAGAAGAGELLAQGIGEQQRLLSAGNVGAQGTLGTGFGQVQNALLGLPVNQQAFAPQQIPLSQIPQNPLAQAADGGPGLIGGVQGAITEKEDSASSFLRTQPTNADILGAISRGDLDAPNVDLDFFDKLLAGPTFGGSRQLLEFADMTDSEFNQRMANSGFNDENKSKMRALVSAIKRLRNDPVTRDAPPAQTANKSGGRAGQRRGRR